MPRTGNRFRRELEKLAVAPYQNSKSLTARAEERSMRIGDYRLLLEVDDGAKTITIGRVGPRGDIYQD